MNIDKMHMTPAQLWRGYNPEGDLNLKIASEREFVLPPSVTEQGEDSSTAPVAEEYLVRELYFNAGKEEDGELRAFGKFVYAKGKSLPAVLILREAGTPLNSNEYSFYLESGCNIFLLDYSGAGDGRSSLFPESLAFAKFSEDTRSSLVYPEDGADKSPLYIWARTAMRAVSLLLSLPECNGSVALHGEKEGGAVSWILAAIDTRVLRAAILFESGYGTTISKHEKSDAFALYNAALSPQAYAQNVKCPLLLLMASNERVAFERIFESIKRVPSGVPAYLSIAPRLNGQITVKNMGTLKTFVREYADGVSLLPTLPTISAQVSGGKLYYAVSLGGEAVKRVKLYYSDGADSAFRNWKDAVCQNVGEGEYIAQATVGDPKNTMFAFANIEYNDSSLLSTAILARKPLEMGLSACDEDDNRPLYDSSMGLDCFINECTGLVNVGVALETGPFDIAGVVARGGNLATYKIADAVCKRQNANGLLVSLCTEQARVVNVWILEKTVSGTRLFKAAKEVAGGRFWQKLTFSQGDFKTADGALLPSWDGAIKLTLEGEILFNNIVLV